MQSNRSEEKSENETTDEFGAIGDDASIRRAIASNRAAVDGLDESIALIEMRLAAMRKERQVLLDKRRRFAVKLGLIDDEVKP